LAAARGIFLENTCLSRSPEKPVGAPPGEVAVTAKRDNVEHGNSAAKSFIIVWFHTDDALGSGNSPGNSGSAGEGLERSGGFVGLIGDARPGQNGSKPTEFGAGDINSREKKVSGRLRRIFPWYANETKPALHE
jgi:hypothetical protein